MEFERHCQLIVEQSELLAGHLSTRPELGTAVPSCPGWNVGQLARHVGGAHREATVVARTGEAPPNDQFRDPTHWYRTPAECAAADVAGLGHWLTDGATELAKALIEFGPDIPISMPTENPTTRFTARRMCHETVMHRADAALALGVPYVVDPEVAADGIDEWMELCALPLHFEVHPWMRELLGPGRTLKFQATDTPDRWYVDLTGEAIRWHHEDDQAAVTIHAPITELLLLIYKRRPAHGADLEIHGDTELLAYYLERVSFG
ncbi:maleylpyruvate isomerase family mycothiol-dependent enzyme [Kribbella sp. NPDC020789]